MLELSKSNADMLKDTFFTHIANKQISAKDKELIDSYKNMFITNTDLSVYDYLLQLYIDKYNHNTKSNDEFTSYVTGLEVGGNISKKSLNDTYVAGMIAGGLCTIVGFAIGAIINKYID